MAEMGGLMVAGWIFAVVLVIAWIMLPFAMIGTKPLLRELLRETKESNRLLLTVSEGATDKTHVRCPDCRELVRADAKKCKHCGTALVPRPL